MKYSIPVFVLCFYAAAIYGQVTFTSSNLPVITINTYGKTIVDEPKIAAYMRIIDNGEGKRNSVTDSANVYSGSIGIEIRGQSSQQFPKKPYGLETRDANGNNLDVSIFGMPADNDWILYPSYSDKTLLRNVLAFYLANNMGRYASRTKYCEVILNGQYIGVYVFMEKIKRGKGRVNIKKLETKDTTGDNITGGYIVKIDKSDPSDFIWNSTYRPPDNSSKKITYIGVYPKAEDITLGQKTYIKSFISNFENVVYQSSYTDPFNRYYDLIDISSFIDTYLMFEFTRNVDSYRISTFLYKDRNSVDGRLKYGPVWDLDFGFGNADYDNAASSVGWEVNYKNDSDFLTPFWCRKIFNDPVFFNALSKRWNQIKNSILSYDSCSAFIDTTSKNIQEARIRNFQKWNILGVYVWPNAYVGKTYDDEINYMKNWIKKRITWLNSAMPDSYSDINWLTPDTSFTNLTTGYTKKIPASYLFNSLRNVDSVVYKASDNSLTVRTINDTVYLTAHTPGSFLLKGAAYRNNQVVLLSSPYTVNSTGVTGVKVVENPYKFSLSQNYPNPFNPVTIIEYSIPKDEFVKLTVYDFTGRTISTLVNENKKAGKYNISFNGTGIATGVYFYKLQAGNYSVVNKMLLLK